MSDPVDREIVDHCRVFQKLKGVGRQRGCDGCEAGEDECWGHYCATVLAPRHGIRPHWNLRLWEREQRVHDDRAQQLWEIPRRARRFHPLFRIAISDHLGKAYIPIRTSMYW